MSFGKDNNRLDTMGGSWMQRARAQASRKPRGGGGAFHWKGLYRPTEYEEGDWVRFFNGSYPLQYVDEDNLINMQCPYVFFREHRDSNDRTCICSAGPFFGRKGKSDPCPSCDVFWDDIAEKKARKASGDRTEVTRRMNCSDRFAWLLYDYGLYVQVAEVDKNGQVRMNQKDNLPYSSWEKGHPHDPKFAGRVMSYKQGNLVAWAMTKTEKDWLTAEADTIGRGCVNCGNKNGIQCAAKICPHCGVTVYEPHNTTMSDEQKMQINNNRYDCRSCGKSGFVGEVLQCLTCPKPQRQTIFDVDMNIRRQRTGEKYLMVRMDHSAPRPLQVTPEVFTYISQNPIDLVAKFTPTTPQAQQGFMTLPRGRGVQPGQVQMAPGVGPGMNFNPQQFGFPGQVQQQTQVQHLQMMQQFQPQVAQTPAQFQPPQFSGMPMPHMPPYSQGFGGSGSGQ